METTTLETSETFGKVATALAQAQTSFQPIKKDRTAYVRSEKGNFSFNYADLAAVLGAVTPALTKAGIAVLQPVVNDGGIVRVQTWLIHGESGEWIRSKVLALEGGRDTKALGIAITYLRRYQIGSLLGVAPEEDVDDGEQTGPRSERRSAPPPQQAARRLVNEVAPGFVKVDGEVRAVHQPPPDRTLEPGHDPAAMTGGSEEPARPDPVADCRAALAAKAWNRALANLQAIPPGDVRKQLQQEYQAARYPPKTNGSAPTQEIRQ